MRGHSKETVRLDLGCKGRKKSENGPRLFNEYLEKNDQNRKPRAGNEF